MNMKKNTIYTYYIYRNITYLKRIICYYCFYEIYKKQIKKEVRIQ